MHITGLRALYAAPISPNWSRIALRGFHASSVGRSSAPTGDAKPPDKPAGHQNIKSGESATLGGREGPIQNASVVDAAHRHARRAPSSPKQRQARNRIPEDLPPVTIPTEFLDAHLSIYDSNDHKSLFDEPQSRSRDVQNLLVALSQAPDNPLRSCLEATFESIRWTEEEVSDAIATGNWDRIHRRSLLVKELAFWILCAQKGLIPETGLASNGEEGGSGATLKGALPNLLSSHLDDLLALKNLHPGDQRWREIWSTIAFEVSDSIRHGRPAMSSDLQEESIFDFDPASVQETLRAIRADLGLTTPPQLAGKDLRRPVNIVTIDGYVGYRYAHDLIGYAANVVGASVLSLGPQEIARLVGNYLGQDWSYSRGPISLLGFKVAELSGRVRSYWDESTGSTSQSADDRSKDIDGTWLSIQAAATNAGRSLLEDELQKIKEGARDYVLPSVDRWENLKINAVLERIVDAAYTRAAANGSDRLIIHIDSFVELNMVLEGALILGRLRNIVDAFWRDGKKIIIVGTSSYSHKNPPQQFGAALRDLDAEECTIEVPLREGRPLAKSRRQLEKLGCLNENLSAIGNMMAELSGSVEACAFGLAVIRNGISLELRGHMSELTDHLLALPEVYHIARKCVSLFHAVGPGVLDRLPTMSREEMSAFCLELGFERAIELPEMPGVPADGSKPRAKTGAEDHPRPQKKKNYNENEKKLLSGLINRDEIRNTFADVHAPPETIQALKLLTSLSLVRPEAFSYGVLATDRIPGCLLYGPPGTGKTLLAKALAKESGASMLEVSGASINDMWVGNSEKNVRALFTLAKKMAPLVIFIDEADALLAARESRGRGTKSREVINQFLREWDGMSETKAFIMVATNRPFDLDEAVLRRLPRKILVDLPLQADRVAILRLLLKDEQLDDREGATVSIDELAAQTPLYSGSDLKNMCVAAAMAAVQEENEAALRHTGEEPYAYPVRRVLRRSHFERALKEIGASISEDMESLKAIQKFDEKYGDPRSRRQKRKSMGFEVMPLQVDANEARVRRESGL